MAQMSSSLLVPVPVERVWETLSQFGEISRWGDGVDQSSLLTEQATGLGAVRRVQLGRTTLRETVTTWEPPRSLGYLIVGLPPIVTKAGNLWTLVPEGEGTRVTVTGTVTTRGGPLPARVVARVVAGVVGRANAKLAAGLAAHVTADLATGATS